MNVGDMVRFQDRACQIVSITRGAMESEIVSVGIKTVPDGRETYNVSPYMIFPMMENKRNTITQNPYRKLLDTCYNGTLDLRSIDIDRLNEAFDNIVKKENFMPIKENQKVRYMYGTMKLTERRVPQLAPIKKVKFSGPATIVFFEDNTKIVLKCSDNDVYDPEKAIMIACLRKATGMTTSAFSKWLKKMTEDAEMDRDDYVSNAINAMGNLIAKITDPNTEDE